MAQLPARLFVLPILVATFFSGWPGLASAQIPSASGCWASPPPPPRVGYVPAGGQPRSSTDISYLEWLRFFGPPQVRQLFPPEVPGQIYKIGERYVGNNGAYPYWLNNVPVLPGKDLVVFDIPGVVGVPVISVPVLSRPAGVNNILRVAGSSGFAPGNGNGFGQLPGIQIPPLQLPGIQVPPLQLNYPTMFLPKR